VFAELAVRVTVEYGRGLHEVGVHLLEGGYHRLAELAALNGVVFVGPIDQHWREDAS